MISKISGKIIEKSPTRIVLQTAGIGFELLISLKTFERLPELESDLAIETYLHVKEDDLKLVGFLDPKEKELFLKLLTVSGISVRIALSALSFYSVRDLCKMIVESQADMIQRVPGIGKRLAERVIIELREKIESMTPADSTMVFSDGQAEEVKDALKALGYSSAEIDHALAKINIDTWKEKSTEEILKSVLKEVYHR